MVPSETMIPYVEIPDLVLWGRIHLRFFGAMVFMALISAYLAARWRAARVGQDPICAGRLVIAAAIGGFVVSHWFAIAFYHPELLAKHGPWYVLKFWTTMSSYGGFIGGTLAFLLYIRIRKLPLWEYLDTLILALATGWFFGRLGCATIHDHRGIPSSFFLAVKFPDGPRHDLGLYEWLFTLLLAIVLWRRAFRKQTPGTLAAITVMSYAPVRFFLDFLRASDRRWLGLTAGQYASIGLGVLGLYIARNVYRRHCAAPSISDPGTPRRPASPHASDGPAG